MPRRPMDRLQAGRRDRVVRLESRPAADVVDAEGAPVDVPLDGKWTTLEARMPAFKDDSAGRERARETQVSAAFDTRWEINYRADMDPDLIDVPKLRRLVFHDRVHDIVAANHLGRRRGIELFTIASAAA